MIDRRDDAGVFDRRERHAILVEDGLVRAVGDEFLEDGLHHFSRLLVTLLDGDAKRENVVDSWSNDELSLAGLLVISSCGGVVEAGVGPTVRTTRMRISVDDGKTWSDEYVTRDDGGTPDLG
ncbi:hypothetical protein ACLMJV_30385 [Sinorhizobium meliloti]|uniref:hypothetical protein n=1 Tax=Rhizobium meliloti TaxID=382 RepID=UPI00398D2993